MVKLQSALIYLNWHAFLKVYNIQLWWQYTPQKRECLTRFLCLHPIIFCSLPVRVHFSLPLVLSALNSKSLYFSLPSFTLYQFLPRLSVCVQFHFSLLMYVHFSPTFPVTASDSHPFCFLPCHYLSMPVSSSSQPLSHCVSFFCCLSSFVSVDSLVSPRAALWQVVKWSWFVPAVMTALCSQDNNSRSWRRRGAGLQGSLQAGRKEKRSFTASHTSARGTVAGFS